jgi:serine O-acetyltransferase
MLTFARLASAWCVRAAPTITEVGAEVDPAMSPPGAWAALRADLRANVPAAEPMPAGLRRVARVARNVFTVRFLAVALLRLAQGLGARQPLLGSLVKQGNHVLTGADLAYQARIGGGLVLYHPTGVVIGPECRLGARAVVMQGVTLGSDAVVVGEALSRSPAIGDDAFLGPGAVVVGEVTLGDRVRVGANSVVRASFPSGSVLVGAPARNIADAAG